MVLVLTEVLAAYPKEAIPVMNLHPQRVMELVLAMHFSPVVEVLVMNIIHHQPTVE